MAFKLERHRDDILRRFDSGESCHSIAISLGCYDQPVTNLIKRYREIKSLRHNQGNTRYFQNIDTTSKAYLVGFIAADGCIQNFTKSSIGLSITIHKKDECVLDFLKKELGCENPVYRVRKDEHCRFTIANKDLVSDLEKLGIGQRKSLTLSNFLENIPKQFRKAAVLGYFDGDGSISIQPNYNNRAYIQIRCTRELATGIVQEMEVDSFHLSEVDSIPSLVIGAKHNVLKFYSMYENCPIFLARKREKFERLFQQDQTISQSSVYLDY